MLIYFLTLLINPCLHFLYKVKDLAGVCKKNIKILSVQLRKNTNRLDGVEGWHLNIGHWSNDVMKHATNLYFI